MWHQTNHYGANSSETLSRKLATNERRNEKRRAGAHRQKLKTRICHVRVRPFQGIRKEHESRTSLHPHMTPCNIISSRVVLRKRVMCTHHKNSVDHKLLLGSKDSLTSRKDSAQSPVISHVTRPKSIMLTCDTKFSGTNYSRNDMTFSNLRLESSRFTQLQLRSFKMCFPNIPRNMDGLAGRSWLTFAGER